MFGYLVPVFEKKQARCKVGIFRLAVLIRLAQSSSVAGNIYVFMFKRESKTKILSLASFVPLRASPTCSLIGNSYCMTKKF